MNGNLLGRPKAAANLDGPEPSEAILDYRRKLEAELLSKVNSTLEPLLGANRFRAGVSVECDFSGGEQSEEVFDPSRSVMVSSQRTEDNSGAPASTGVPGTASSLPRPTSRPGNGSKAVSRVTENVTYQTTRTVKKMRLPAGGIRKMSLAVMVDQELHWERDGNGYTRVLVPPPPEKLKIIRDVVAGVTGFTAERGDQFVIDTLPFETTMQLEPPALPPASGPAPAPVPQSLWRLQLDRKQMIMAGGAGAGVLLLLGAALWLLRRRGKQKKAGGVQASSPAALSAAAAEPGNHLEEQMESKLAERDALQHKLEAEALSSLKLAPVITKTSEVLAKHLREKITKEPDVASQILRAWVREEEAED
jgi:flagellar M-ring protein FliF